MKTLLACLNSADHAKDALNAALPIARRHNSHLIGLHTLEKLPVYPGVSVHIPPEVYADYHAAREAESEAVKAVFDDLTAAADFPCEWRAIKAASLDASDRMVEVAHFADLVIMAQADITVDDATRYHAQEHVIRRSGRPVLLVPTDYPGNGIGKKVVIGWSPTREAARAVHDALPLLEDGAEIHIANVAQRASDGYEGATELASALDRHGYKTNIAQRTAARDHIADEIETMAFELGADLIVTGAFGHSRLYDFVIGAVTLDLMRTARLPVLFSR